MRGIPRATGCPPSRLVRYVVQRRWNPIAAGIMAQVCAHAKLLGSPEFTVVIGAAYFRLPRSEQLTPENERRRDY